VVSFIGQFIYGYDLKRKVIDVKVKKLLALIIVISIILCLASCTSSPYDEGYEAGYHDGENEGYQEGFDDGEEAGYEYYVERAEESFDANEIIEWVLSHYTIADLMEWQYGSVYDYYFEIGAPNISLFVDESIAQGHPEYIEYMLSFCNSLGYSPELLLGNYCADGDLCIHTTNGPCFNSINLHELIVIGPYGNISEVRRRFENTKYTICEICCK